MTIEQRLAEAIRSFHLDSLSSAVPLNVEVKDCYLYIECTLERVVDGFGPNSLLIGEVVAAAAREGALRRAERDEADQLFQFPLLAYLSPGRVAEVRQSLAFPLPKGFSR